jgi:small-conductance mechanosensitive channel
MSDTAHVIAGYVAELEAKRRELVAATEAVESLTRENVRLSNLLKDAQQGEAACQAHAERLQARIQSQGGE